MNIIKISNLSSILLDDKRFNEIATNNPWGFIIELPKLGKYTGLPYPQFGHSFSKDVWTFKQLK